VSEDKEEHTMVFMKASEAKEAIAKMSKKERFEKLRDILIQYRIWDMDARRAKTNPGYKVRYSGKPEELQAELDNAIELMDMLAA
jgi:hypothetical protein